MDLLLYILIAVIAVILAGLLLGLVLPKERKIQSIEFFTSDLEKVWKAVTDNSDYSWRSDIEKLELSEDGNEWTEYPKGGKPIKFTIKKKTQYSDYIFVMDGPFFTGEWIGKFERLKTGDTKGDFEEKLYIKGPVMNVLAYLFFKPQKLQEVYIRDLKKKLGEKVDG